MKGKISTSGQDSCEISDIVENLQETVIGKLALQRKAPNFEAIKLKPISKKNLALPIITIKNKILMNHPNSVTNVPQN